MSEDFAGGDVAELRRQLEERTSTIQTMKVKTKDFIAKMQAGLYHLNWSIYILHFIFNVRHRFQNTPLYCKAKIRL